MIDGSTLEALFKKLKSLEDIPQGQLAGKMGVVIDLVTRLPVEIWFQENLKASDKSIRSRYFKFGVRQDFIALRSGFLSF